MEKFLRKLMTLSALAVVACAAGSAPGGAFRRKEAPQTGNAMAFRRLRAADLKSGVNAAAEIVRDNLKSFKTGNSYSLSRSKLLHDFNGNEYVLAEFSPFGYGIYNVANGDVVEAAPGEESPFSKTDGDLYYLPWVGCYEKIREDYFDLSTGKALPDEALARLKEESDAFVERSLTSINEANIAKVDDGVAFGRMVPMRVADGDHPIWNGEISADTEVPYSWYFKRCAVEFPTNSSGYCGYVAGSMLLAYNEIFKSTGYFSAAEASNYISPFRGSWTGSWNSSSSQNGPLGVPDLSDSFPRTEWGQDIGGSAPNDIANAINSFMAGKSKDYDLYNYVSVFSNIYDPIKDGVPAAYFGNISMLNGGNHVIVVYGKYNDGRLLCHFGWEYKTQVMMSRLGLFQEGGVLAVYNHSAHVHNKYFINNVDGHKYCGCGVMVEC